MKFSICLPTGFEGVMYPVPFVAPADFVRLAQLCEKLGYHSVWGNDHIQTQHYVRELFPETPPNQMDLDESEKPLRPQAFAAEGWPSSARIHD